MERGDPAAAKVVADAADRTRAEGSARAAMVVKANGRSILHAAGLTRLDRDLTRLSMTLDAAAGGLPAGARIEALMAADEAYVRQNGQGWVHVSSDAVATGFSTGFESLEYLGAVTGNVEQQGTQTVRGEEVRVYSATVDLERVTEQLPADQRAAYEKERARTGVPDRLPLEVSIDERGRLTRMDYSVEVRGQELFARVDLFDFGAKGDLSPPKHYVEAGK
jgi:hypothetical protein